MILNLLLESQPSISQEIVIVITFPSPLPQSIPSFPSPISYTLTMMFNVQNDTISWLHLHFLSLSLSLPLQLILSILLTSVDIVLLLRTFLQLVKHNQIEKRVEKALIP